MKKRKLLFTAMLAICLASSAQTIQQTGQGAKFQTIDSKLSGEVIFYSSDIVRILKYPTANAPEKKSFPVVKIPEKVKIAYSSPQENVLCMQTGCLTVVLDAVTGRIIYKGPQGTTLLAEKEQGTRFTPAQDAGQPTYNVSQAFTLQPDEAIYGLGQRQSNAMNHRNQQIYLCNTNTNICIPYFTSSQGYGVYWDNPGISYFSDTSAETSFTSQTGLCADYYFLYRDGSQDGVIGCLRELTGRATMFPRWALGYWQSRERYKSPDELCDVLDRYRKLKVPLDVMVQDWQYWGCDSNWNAMRFMNPRYTNRMGDPEAMRYLPNGEDPAARYDSRIKSPEEMIDYIHGHNAHLMISVWASFGPWTSQYQELDKMGGLLKFETWPPKSGAHPYDPFNPAARDLYWRYLSHLYDMGIDAWWTDSTEPDHLNPKESDFDLLTADGSFRSVHNAYPLVHNRGVYEHQRAVSSDRRVIQMTRSGYLGEQHYGTLSWSGDVASSWEVMRQQIPAGLNFTLCGIPFWNTDLAGFFSHEYNNDWKNLAYQELHVRWFQWGCFLPLMRNHCSSPMLNEIYLFGREGDWAYDVQKRFIELRYRLQPYLYSMQGDVVLNDGSMMRPLIMDFPHDRKAILLDDEYMFGPAFLVCPVTRPLYTTKDEQNRGISLVPDGGIGAASLPFEVYLPEGADWVDFWSNELMKGGVDINRDCPVSLMPLYVKAGSILPLGPEVQYSGEKAWDVLDICIYPGADGEFTLYEDEFDNYNYEQGCFSTIRFHWDEETRTLTIGQRRGEFEGMLQARDFRLTLMTPDKPSAEKPVAHPDRQVHYEGHELKIRF
ncbi:DUF5110 domain-containing protein [Bacteroides sp. ET71]|uniref:glycoside hydrolase family 31 protein n=1 Tax=Bacteroides sp. ET71 TaxID=2939421 RepID=UPI002012C32F|nr:TIM-barrel domain-containing protein [Bacteroides sp. ET71]MCL1615651.1 DUF5110 domain-containing protein [Bacteroides sp. ET71]